MRAGCDRGFGATDVRNQRHHGEPPDRFIPVVRDELVQQRAHVVHVARVIAGEPLEREQGGTAHAGAFVDQAAAQKLALRAEPELADRALGDRPLAEVGRARGGLELLVPLRAQPGQLLLLASLFGQGVSRSRRFGEAHRSARVRGGGPT